MNCAVLLVSWNQNSSLIKIKTKKESSSSNAAVPVVLCDLNVGLFLAFCVGHALPTKKQRNQLQQKMKASVGVIEMTTEIPSTRFLTPQ